MAARRTVLVVDDNEMNAKLLRVLLTSVGYDVRVARDGPEALMLAHETGPALIFMDIQLPGMDGLHVTRILRERAGTRTTPIVAVTSFAMKGDRERALAAGCDDYMAKPVDSQELLALARRLAGTPAGRAKVKP